MSWLENSLRITLTLVGVYSLAFTAFADESIDFNRDIRPILSENCFYCHGQDGNKRQADLQLHVRQEAVNAGAIVPHDAAKSSLIQRILTDKPDELMPPPKSNRHLTAEQKTLLQKWINSGADYQTHWAYVTPKRPAEPITNDTAWSRNAIDRFVLAKLDQAGLKPSPEADRVTLIRRLYIDLVGLPPKIEEVDAFVNDPDPKAYEHLVDRLLQSPHYGERMSLPWLDAARYADSNGFQQDGDTWQWIWRDWVVKALNEDLPFDQFTIWQLAGDLLPNATNDQKIASGFNRNHLLNGEGGAIPEEQRFVNLFDRVDTTATTWMGLTMACCQCHDHKYDPLTQRDYYGLLDAFNRVPENGTPQRMSRKMRVAAPYLELISEQTKKQIADYESQIQKLDQETGPVIEAAYEAFRIAITSTKSPDTIDGLPGTAAAVLMKPEAERSDDEKKTLDNQLRTLFNQKARAGVAGKYPAISKADSLRSELNEYRGDNIQRPMIMSDEKPRETAILDRGEYLQPKDKVTFSTPAVLPPMAEGAPRNRLGFAQWLVAPENPLTARVQVNRMWQYFFGVGLVKTAEDFGVQSEYPLHGELLDWLAVEFRENGWSMKRMHRLIVTSSTYRQSSRMSPELRHRDPENRLIARASRFRMPAMILRDWALASAGVLNGQIGGKPVYPYQPDGIWESLAITKERDFTYPKSSGTDLYRRSLYTFWRRTVGPANMFDAANRQTCRVRTSPTSTPLHALTTLNDPTWVETSRILAENSMKLSPSLDARLTHAFRQILSRPPRDSDLSLLRRAYERQLAFYQGDAESAKALLAVGESKRDENLNREEHAALASVCRMILNLDEALTRE